jgi:hypothetical protein
MTRQAFLVQANHLRSLRGEVCVGTKTGAGPWALSLDFGVLHSPDARRYRAPEKGLVVECPWRLEATTAVLVASADGYASEHAPAARSLADIETALQVCVGKRVERITVYRPPFMVRLALSGALRLWAFPENTGEYQDDGDPRCSWYLAGRAFPGGWHE